MPEETSGEFIIKKEPIQTPLDHYSGLAQKKSAGLLSNLILYPQNISFQDQEANELVVLLIRHDLITNVPWIISAIVLIFIPPLISALSGLFAPFFTLSGITQLILVIFYYIIVFGFIIVQFTLWYFNATLLTNVRIIDYDVTGILVKKISETKLNLIEDVTYSQVGSIRNVFDYGDVLVQTAGASENFELELVPQPQRIEKIIGDLIGGPR